MRQWFLVGYAISLVFVSGCALTPNTTGIAEIPEFRVGSTTISPAQALLAVPDIDPLALSTEMKDYADNNIRIFRNQRQRVQALNQALRGSGGLALSYDPEKTLTAKQVFKTRVANCLAYSNLFIAMARYSGIEARYQEVELRPNWTQRKGWVTVGKHVNVTGRVRNVNYTADFSPDLRRELLSTRPVSDQEARSQLYNNLAVDFLTTGDLRNAYLYSAKAIAISRSSYLWVNLGAILKANRQYEAAEQAYFVALKKNRANRQALTNLAVLYQELGRKEESRKYAAKVRRYRFRNPFYHAGLAHIAERNGDLPAALRHMQDAIERGPRQASLFYQRARLEQTADQPKAALQSIERALGLVSNKLDRVVYKSFRDRLRAAAADD